MTQPFRPLYYWSAHGPQPATHPRALRRWPIVTGLVWFLPRRAIAECWEVVFRVLSGVLVALVTWWQFSTWLRLTLWVLFAVFATAALLAER